MRPGKDLPNSVGELPLAFDDVKDRDVGLAADGDGAAVSAMPIDLAALVVVIRTTSAKV